MRILIVGAGLSGCTLARSLKDKGHEVSLIEKENHLGGLCITRIGPHGIKYEPFGGRTFHTNNKQVEAFVRRFDDFNSYQHRKGMIINNRLFPFPITRKSIENFENKDQIYAELAKLNGINRDNFEVACISIFGRTLYEYFIKNYTQKMWGRPPHELTAEWAPKRLELRTDDSQGLFGEQWQGLPKNGYTYLLGKMIEGISLFCNTGRFNPDQFDVVAVTAAIDETMEYRLGKLEYRSLKFSYTTEENWENDAYGTINLPQHDSLIRKCNFKVLHQQDSDHTYIQYQEPVQADEQNVAMYPVNSSENDKKFDEYLELICKTKNLCPVGRLGLFKYLDMDKAVASSLEIAEIITDYSKMNFQERVKTLSAIREHY